jgi:2-polyprenyl-3-methyl-5-hydroxy-6-metoxy-1,4-benzoquinol methylase
MDTETIDKNIAANREAHLYSTTPASVTGAIARLVRWEEFLREPRSEKEWSRFLAAQESWSRAPWGLLTDGLRSRLPGARVLDFGAGRGFLAAVMAMLGADVVAIDVSPSTPTLVDLFADRFALKSSLRGISGDLRGEAPDLDRFDLVVGTNVLHHLVPELEEEIVATICRLLDPDGAAVFIEPCEQSPWLTAIKDRLWPEGGAHPERPNDVDHYEALGRRYFQTVEIRPFGSLERWVGLVPPARRSGVLRSMLLGWEGYLPSKLHLMFAASQRIEYARPIR